MKFLHDFRIKCKNSKVKQLAVQYDAHMFQNESKL